MAKHLAMLLKDAGLNPAADLRAMCASDDRLSVAFTFGVLEALKAAAGVKLSLEI